MTVRGDFAHKHESQLLEALRRGDSDAFGGLIDQHHSALVRLARVWVPAEHLAEEVAQETWLAVIEGIDGFEGRSSLKTWIVRILINKARQRAKREGRTIAFGLSPDADEAPPIGPARFSWIGRWKTPPRPWHEDTPERLVLAAEALKVIEEALLGLPPAQRAVILMRDVEGFDANEVCNVLEVTQTNQRVLLHRARSRLRDVIEAYMDRGETRR